MKKSIIVMLAIVMATLSSRAQTKHSHSISTTVKVFDNTNAEVKAQVNTLLIVYYKMKDALVADNEANAAAAAKEFRKALEQVDMKKMTTDEHTFFMGLQEKLDYDAEHISTAPNIDHMREHFASFSENVFTVVKAFKANNGNSVYLDYCPMQKASWISSEEVIKNPYYGKQMPECGSVKETLK